MHMATTANAAAITRKPIRIAAMTCARARYIYLYAVVDMVVYSVDSVFGRCAYCKNALNIS